MSREKKLYLLGSVLFAVRVATTLAIGAWMFGSEFTLKAALLYATMCAMQFVHVASMKVYALSLQTPAEKLMTDIFKFASFKPVKASADDEGEGGR